jgi:hypothetical protein
MTEQRTRAPGAHGRPSRLTAEQRARIARRRTEGATLWQIAGELDHDQVPTGHGAPRWTAGSVAYVLSRLRQP